MQEGYLRALGHASTCMSRPLCSWLAPQRQTRWGLFSVTRTSSFKRAKRVAMSFSLMFKKVREKTPYHDDQSLGQKIGRIDIRCTLKADASHWTKSPDCLETAEITGLLHFNIEYRAQASVPLRSASVQIDVGAGVNAEPVPTVKACAPLSAISGFDANYVGR